MQSVSLCFGLVLYLQPVNEKENIRLDIADCDFRVQVHRTERTFAFQELFPLKYHPELFRLKCPPDSLSVKMIFKKKNNEIVKGLYEKKYLE